MSAPRAAVAALAVAVAACGGAAPPTTSAGREPALEVQRGHATWYGERYHGRTTASGAPFDMHALTAAHRTLPFGARVRVTNERNGRQVEVRITDRGPFGKDRRRIIDLSRAAASALDFLDAGWTPVVLEVLSLPPRRR